MKQIFLAVTLLTLCTPLASRCQDAATEVRFKQLSKRVEDNEKIGATLDKIKKTLESSIKSPRGPGNQPGERERPSADRPPGSTSKPPPEKGLGEYTIQPGDTISAIIAAYKEKNIK